LPNCPEEPIAPQPTHFVVNTHDIDFLTLSRWTSLARLLKNAGNSLFNARMGLGTGQICHALRVALGGKDPLDQINALSENESEIGVGATYMVVAAKRHRRDPNYELRNPAVRCILNDIARTGAEIGVHGSYTSMDDEDQLSREFLRLRHSGFCPIGSRQHWLRFTVGQLVTSLERASAVYDTSLGWRDQIGFRAGACFPFPLYDFNRECAAGVLEIPLIVMDQALQSDPDPLAAATALLETSRRFGWGGISVLWHPASFAGAQLPPEIGNAFWTLLRERHGSCDTWISGASFLAAVRERYSAAGLPIREGSNPRENEISTAEVDVISTSTRRRYAV
jgi:hypothetical protein